MASTSRRSIAGALVVALALSLTPTAATAGPSQKQIMAACKKKYGKTVFKAEIAKGGKDLRCFYLQPGRAKPMTRNEVYNYCRKKFNATTVILAKTSKGWNCRYYGLY